MEAWVENGHAPDVISGAHVRTSDLDLMAEQDRVELERRNTFPLQTENVAFTRPIYPYPDVAKYLGQGDPNDAANFSRVRSR
jgi:feruloyl esterase